MITVPEFLKKTGARAWRECHWSVAKTREQAEAWFSAHGGIVGDIYAVPFGFWMVIK